MERADAFEEEAKAIIVCRTCRSGDVIYTSTMSSATTSNYTTATAMLEVLEAAGVTELFANFGSDPPAIIEAMSKRKADGNR